MSPSKRVLKLQLLVYRRKIKFYQARHHATLLLGVSKTELIGQISGGAKIKLMLALAIIED